MLPQNVEAEFKKIAKRVTIVVLLLATSAFVFSNISVVWGIIIGGMMAITNFRLIALSTVQILELTSPTQAKAKAIVKYLIRASLTIGVMYVSFTNDWISFPALVVGLLLVKYIILFEAVYLFVKNSMKEFFHKQKLKYERGDNR
ncbi:ATP synthase subunit I [Alkalicella caledoniensis]|uniref:ATP synthase subunit I n=1 Tax=Alkalicella caledoniensis TaxID=2731377 RepID=A0A7G9W906_ALKCA|nr:ATP synthase subunit I [Alkalicella caledoniensis]QNO15168.1 ATP synthase subunit I [Alkalicella caledoniensis]